MRGSWCAARERRKAKKKEVRARVLRDAAAAAGSSHAAGVWQIARSAQEWRMGWRTLREQADDDRRLQSQHSAS
jgi:hypothetical protein